MTSFLPARTAVGLVAGVALLGACAGAPEDDDAVAASGDYPASVTSCDFTTTVEAAPAQVVTVYQGATEVMLALGLQDHLLATYGLDDAVADRWADAYEAIPVIEGDSAPSREELLSRGADFVYGSYISAFEDKTAGSREELADLGVAAYVSPFSCGTPETSRPASFENVWAEVRDIATLFDVEDRAEDFIESQQSELLEIEAQQAGEGLSIFWYDSGDKVPYTGVGTGAPQIIIDTVAATNPFASIKGNWADVSWEQVIAADPDVIVLADASWSTADEKIAYLENDPVLSQLRAVRAGSYVTIPFSETTPGVRVLDGAAHVSEQLADLPIG